MQPLHIFCTHCRAEINCPRKFVGRTVKCPKCGKPFRVVEPLDIDEDPFGLERPPSSGGKRAAARFWAARRTSFKAGNSSPTRCRHCDHHNVRGSVFRCAAVSSCRFLLRGFRSAIALVFRSHKQHTLVHHSWRRCGSAVFLSCARGGVASTSKCLAHWHCKPFFRVVVAWLGRLSGLGLHGCRAT